MILLDTNIVLALLSKDERERRNVLTHWAELGRAKLYLTIPVIGEVTNFLTRPHEYAAFVDLAERLQFDFLPSEAALEWKEIVHWMRQYAEHEPDWVDAYLVMLTTTNPRLRVWSNDSGFTTIWRRPDGSAVPMAVRR